MTVLLGHIHFDAPNSKGGLSEFLALKDKVPFIFRSKYVKIDGGVDTTFLGRIIDGPFFVPEEVGRDSAFAQTAILHGEEFKAMPNFYTLARLEILGELQNGALRGTNTRPLPKTGVRDLTSGEIQKLIGLQGDMVLGALVGYGDVRVLLDSNSKKVVPRNIGVFGTVGSGKTNTAQVLIEEAAQSGFAIVVLDVEGEYVDMDTPTNEAHLIEKLRANGRKPEGIKDFKVYHPTGGEASRRDSVEFGIPFSAMPPYLVSELADLSEPQEGVFLKAIESLQERFGKARSPKKPKSRAASFLEGEEDHAGYTLQDLLDALPEDGGDAGKGTLWALYRKLTALRRTQIFDEKTPLDVRDLLVGGRVSVIDVSTLANDNAKNIAIAWTLRQIFNEKVNNTKAPKTLVVIEEAHTFISKESRERMTATMDMLKLIARRGRKRWLGLAFISQQPSHIPDEIFELCNTRVIHCVKSEFNLNPLKRTSGDVVSELWDMLPSLGPGQAIVTSPQFNHTVLVDMRPSAGMSRPLLNLRTE